MERVRVRQRLTVEEGLLDFLPACHHEGSILHDFLFKGLSSNLYAQSD